MSLSSLVKFNHGSLYQITALFATEPLGVPGGETQANKASHRKAEKVTGRTAELFDERYCILVEGLHVVATACHLAQTLAAEVEGHASVTLLEQRDLGIEHATTPQQAMRKDDGFRPCAMLLIIERRPIHTDDSHADYSFTHKQPPPRRAIVLQPRSKKTQGKASPTQRRNLRPNLSRHSTLSLCRRALFLLTTNLVIPKKCTPGATAEHERLHERSFGLDGVVQVVGCPGVQHLCQSDGTQRGMLFRPSQVFIRHLFEQEKAFLPSACERRHQLRRCQ